MKATDVSEEKLFNDPATAVLPQEDFLKKAEFDMIYSHNRCTWCRGLQTFSCISSRRENGSERKK